MEVGATESSPRWGSEQGVSGRDPAAVHLMRWIVLAKALSENSTYCVILLNTQFLLSWLKLQVLEIKGIKGKFKNIKQRIQRKASEPVLREFAA